MQEVKLRIGSKSDIAEVTKLYCGSFPDQLRALFDGAGVQGYLYWVIRSPSYRLVIAQGVTQILGFAVLRIGRNTVIAGGWKYFSLIRYFNRYIFNIRDAKVLLRKTLKDGGSKDIRSLDEELDSQRDVLIKESIMGELAYIEFMGVLPEARGMGIGAELIGRCMEVAKDANCLYIGLTVSARNTYGLRLYERMGFKRVAFSSNKMTFNCLKRVDQ